jgi:hypothetical protein
MRSNYLLAVALPAEQLPLWRVILALFPGVSERAIEPVDVLRRGDDWVAGVPKRLRTAGLPVPGESLAPAPAVSNVVGPEDELAAAVRELRAAGVPSAVVAYHRSRAYRGGSRRRVSGT